jgi:hypothetical protein
MPVKQFRPYLSLSEIEIILSHLDKTIPAQKELHAKLFVYWYKAKHGIAAAATIQIPIEEKLGFTNPEIGELTPEQEEEQMRRIMGEP